MLKASKRSAQTVSLGCDESGYCRAAIAKLREDNAKLKEELLLENKFSVTPTSSNLSANIANLQDQSDVYTRKVWPVRNSNVLFWCYYVLYALLSCNSTPIRLPATCNLASGGHQFTHAPHNQCMCLTLTHSRYIHQSRLPKQPDPRYLIMLQTKFSRSSFLDNHGSRVKEPCAGDHYTYHSLSDLTLLTGHVQIGLERSRLLELEEKANSLQGKIGTQRKAMGGVNAAREANIQVHHRMYFSHVRGAGND